MNHNDTQPSDAPFCQASQQVKANGRKTSFPYADGIFLLIISTAFCVVMYECVRDYRVNGDLKELTLRLREENGQFLGRDK
jgi:hypothetical protein